MTAATRTLELSEASTKLATAIQALAEQLCQRPLVYNASLCELGSAAVRLRSPITIKVEEFPGDDEVIASWPEVEAWASAGSEIDAINALKDEIRGLHTELSATPDHELGELPRRWKRALAAVIEVVG